MTVDLDAVKPLVRALTAARNVTAARALRDLIAEVELLRDTLAHDRLEAKARHWHEQYLEANAENKALRALVERLQAFAQMVLEWDFLREAYAARPADADAIRAALSLLTESGTRDGSGRVDP